MFKFFNGKTMRKQAQSRKAEVIETAEQITPVRQHAHQFTTSREYQVDNVERVTGMWAQTNAAALKYDGPSSEEVLALIKEKQAAVAKAQTEVTRAHLALVNSLGGEEAASKMSAMQQNELIDPSLIKEKNRVGRIAQLHRDELEEARKALGPAQAHEKAKAEAAAILAPMLAVL